MTTFTRQAGGIDWVTTWRQMYNQEREQAEGVTEPGFAQYADFWRTRALRFARVSEDAVQPDAFMQALQNDLQPTDTVLDVGAGTGRHIPFLARSVAHVIAVEPSEAMRTQLERRIEEELLNNASVLAELWPPSRPVEADVVLSVNVVYGVGDIAPFLQGMNAAARRTCHLCLGIEHPTGVLAPLWQHFHGEQRYALPAALEALNVLYQLGYPAQMQVVPNPTHLWYSDWEDALEDVRERLRFTPNEKRDQAIQDALRSDFVQRNDGSVVPRNIPPFAAIVSWSKQ